MSVDSAKEKFFIPVPEFDGVEYLHSRHLMVFLAVLLPSCSAVLLREDDGNLNRARELNQKLLVLDTHLDTPSRALKLPGWVLHE